MEIFSSVLSPRCFSATQYPHRAPYRNATSNQTHLTVRPHSIRCMVAISTLAMPSFCVGYRRGNHRSERMLRNCQTNRLAVRRSHVYAIRTPADIQLPIDIAQLNCGRIFHATHAYGARRPRNVFSSVSDVQRIGSVYLCGAEIFFLTLENQYGTIRQRCEISHCRVRY